MREANTFDFSLLILLAIIWGSSFFNIKLATYSYEPITLALVRVIFASIPLLILCKIKNIYIEAESSKIGNLHIPQPLWKKMLSSKKINIETTFESRVKFLLNDYKYAQLDNNFFKPLINGLKRRLSKKLIADWKQHIKNKDWKQLTESLLINHYDPAYISNYEKKNQKIIKNFTFNKVTKSELNLLANKILNL